MNREEFLEKFEKVPVEEKVNKVVGEPEISVCIQTYQHSKYIRQCLDSILDQKVNFDYEILLGEDASNDGTREICIEYADKFPDKIRLFLHSRKNNIEICGHPTGRFNFMYNLFHARGRYVAFCEGDDYWVDPQKLQKQYNFLEDHSECSVCFTAAQFHFEQNPAREKIYRPKKAASQKRYDLKDAIIKAGEFMITASIFFRQKYMDEIPEWMFNSPVGDLPLSLFLGTKGKYGYIDDVTCVYRVNTSGSWSHQMNFEKRREHVFKILEMYDEFNEYTDYKYNWLVQIEKARIHFNDKKSIVKRAIAKTPPGRKIKEWFDL